MRRTLQHQAEKALTKMGYKIRDWIVYRNEWLFGFVTQGKNIYGCIAFSSTKTINIEILRLKEYKNFNI